MGSQINEVASTIVEDNTTCCQEDAFCGNSLTSSDRLSIDEFIDQTLLLPPSLTHPQNYLTFVCTNEHELFQHLPPPDLFRTLDTDLINASNGLSDKLFISKQKGVYSSSKEYDV